MPQVTKILKPAELVPGIANAVERSTLEALGVKNHTMKLNQKRLDRAQRVVEILVVEGILGVEPEAEAEETFEPDSVGSTGDIR